MRTLAIAFSIWTLLFWGCVGALCVMTGCETPAEPRRDTAREQVQHFRALYGPNWQEWPLAARQAHARAVGANLPLHLATEQGEPP